MRGSIVLGRRAIAHVRRGVALIAQLAGGARPLAIPVQVTICAAALRMKGMTAGAATARRDVRGA